MLSNLFNTLISYGKYVRTNKLDGLEYWKKIKKIIEEQDIKITQINNKLGKEWSITRKINGKIIYDLQKIYDYVHNELNMYGEEKDDVLYHLNHDLWSKYHFYLQLARIPLNNKLDLIRLLQIAYNLGQLSVHLDNEPIVYNDNVLRYYYLNTLGDINSYINFDERVLDENNIEIINNIKNTIKEIIDSKVGGFEYVDYKSKYLKYKSKYLQLKNI